MSMENDMTARIYGAILAEGMCLADCDLEGKIESEALEKLKEIKTVICSGEAAGKKLEQVKMILEK